MTSYIETDTPLIPELGRFRGGGNRPMMAMLEITNRCNMSCPVCFTDARRKGPDLAFDEIERRLDKLLEIAGLIPLQISGGEPTLHPQLGKIIELARRRGFRNIELVTNGIVISTAQDYLDELVDRGLTAVYLQFDGLSAETYKTIRGQDMSAVRHRSIAAIRQAKICCTLAVAVTPGVNDGELGDVVRFGIANIDTVRAINFQSATPFAGRYQLSRRERGYSLAELVALIEEQCKLDPGGFVSDIFGHPRCNTMSLVYVVDGHLKPLFSYISPQTRRNFLGREPRLILLDLFYKEIGSYSPDSHPHLFSDEDARLAYWINSYNLTTIKGVLHNYPISSVEEVAPPALLFFFPSKSGFFFFQRFTYGGVETSLYYLENSVIRKRFVDPRYHFALNCASSSCPQLPRVPFYPDRLDEQLEMESNKFINSVDNVRYDKEQKTLYLSAIFDWYEKDFLNWLALTSPGQNLTIVDYILGYLDQETAVQIRKDRDTLKIDYLPYDWGLNDQRGASDQTSK